MVKVFGFHKNDEDDGDNNNDMMAMMMTKTKHFHTSDHVKYQNTLIILVYHDFLLIPLPIDSSSS